MRIDPKLLKEYHILRELDKMSGDIGIYPMAHIDKNGIETKRTEWQDGWNACVMDFYRRLDEVVYRVEEEYNQHFMTLVSAGILSYDDSHKKYVVWINDTFHYACGDLEVVDEKDYDELGKLFFNYGWPGVLYWIAEKRGYDPNIPEHAKTVQKVRKEIKNVQSL